MKRTVYENEATLSREREFADMLAGRVDMGLQKLPRQYRVDFAMVDKKSGEVYCWLETKCRTGRSFKHFMLSLSKWQAGIRLSQETGKPFLIGFRWKDGDYILQVNKDYIPLLLVGGRDDRDDPEDIEPVVQIPKKMFHLIKPEPKQEEKKNHE